MTAHLLVVVKSNTKMYNPFTIVMYMSSEIKMLHSVQQGPEIRVRNGLNKRDSVKMLPKSSEVFELNTRK